MQFIISGLDKTFFILCILVEELSKARSLALCYILTTFQVSNSTKHFCFYLVSLREGRSSATPYITVYCLLPRCLYLLLSSLNSQVFCALSLFSLSYFDFVLYISPLYANTFDRCLEDIVL